jgi:hypothetical protein
MCVFDFRQAQVGIEDEGLVDRLLRAKNDPPKPLATNVGAAVDRPSDPQEAIV